MAIRIVIWISMAVIVAKICCFSSASAAAELYSSRLFHRFSDEITAVSGERMSPERGSLEYYQRLLISDFRRQNMRLDHLHQLLFPSEGSETMSFGNDLGWLHYTWIDIGTPNISFLVALDAGSDLLWVPCDCIKCAPLSASFYSSLDRDLNEYSPASSSTSTHLPCGHQLCELGSKCKNSTQPCPYNVEYYTENTSSSGLLVEDVLYLSSSSHSSSNTSVQASVVIGCGKKQTGGYLDGVAPDGLMGLGLGDLSVPSFLAKAGLVRNSFSLCFNDNGSGRVFFGDQGPTSQQSTPFLRLDGKYSTYLVEVATCCIGKNSCLKQTSFQAIVDSGTSFTFLPTDVYKSVVEEFDRQVNAPRATYEGYPWEYCYRLRSQEGLDYPLLTLMFALNNSFMVHDLIFPVPGEEGPVGFCLPVQPANGDIGTIGQNFMTGYRMVFDRENMTLGWSPSDCEDLSSEKQTPAAPPPTVVRRPPSPLPRDEQQSPHSGHAISPAIAGRAPPKFSAASTVRAVPLVPVSLFLCFLVAWLSGQDINIT